MASHTPEEIEHKFWKALRSDMTVMLGLPGQVAARPMTAQLRDKEDHGPLYFFTSTETELGQALTSPAKCEFAFVSKGNDVFATCHGTLTVDDDPQAIDDLWNPYVAAWFEGGKSDPKMRLLRLDAGQAEIWLDASSLLAGAKILLGQGDPKEEFSDNVARVHLD